MVQRVGVFLEFLIQHAIVSRRYQQRSEQLDSNCSKDYFRIQIQVSDMKNSFNQFLNVFSSR